MATTAAVRKPADDTIAIHPLTGSIGAEVAGIRLAALDDAGFAAIKQAFLDNCMLVFRDQFITPEQQLALAGRFGEVAVTPFVSYLEEYPGLLPLNNRGKAESVTENWHYDSTFLPAPHALSILSARDMPPQGGDTMWSNQYLAYETLSPGMQRLCGKLKAKFCGTRLARITGNAGGEIPFSYHPIVRTHPETGRKALFVGHPGDTVPCFEGMSEEESLPLLDYLYRHSQSPDRIYRHMWRNGDVVIWDNRCTMHYAVHDYGTQVRHLHRVTVKGLKPA